MCETLRIRVSVAEGFFRGGFLSCQDDCVLLGKRNTTGVTISHVRSGGDEEEDYDSDDADLDAMTNDFGGNSIFKF